MQESEQFNYHTINIAGVCPLMKHRGWGNEAIGLSTNVDMEWFHEMYCRVADLCPKWRNDKWPYWLHINCRDQGRSGTHPRVTPYDLWPPGHRHRFLTSNENLGSKILVYCTRCVCSIFHWQNISYLIIHIKEKDSQNISFVLYHFKVPFLSLHFLTCLFSLCRAITVSFMSKREVEVFLLL